MSNKVPPSTYRLRGVSSAWQHKKAAANKTGPVVCETDAHTDMHTTKRIIPSRLTPGGDSNYLRDKKHFKTVFFLFGW